MELSHAAPDLGDACAVDAPIGEKGDNGACRPAQPAPAVPPGHPPREAVAERRVVPVGVATVAHALSMRPGSVHIQEFS